MDQLPIVSCDNCGACCMGMGIPPETGDDAIDDAWWESLTDELRQEILDRQGQPNWAHEPCVWLDVETRRCTHYELRPQVCRDFEPGNLVCLEDREARGIAPAGN